MLKELRDIWSSDNGTIGHKIQLSVWALCRPLGSYGVLVGLTVMGLWLSIPPLLFVLTSPVWGPFAALGWVLFWIYQLFQKP